MVDQVCRWEALLFCRWDQVEAQVGPGGQEGGGGCAGV